MVQGSFCVYRQRGFEGGVIMCGFAGFLGSGSGRLDGNAERIATAMNDAIRHRGPDDSGVWSDDDAPFVVGHRRLSIVDLSQAGHQPMVSCNGRYLTAYNGEIYNHLEIRRELEASRLAPQWRGHSDTETLLAGFEAWGVAETLKRCTGMFALALWDRETRQLMLARDRLGEKPLYFGWVGKGAGRVFLFGSDLAALEQHPSFDCGVDRDALALMLQYGYVPAPYSIYSGVEKLMPGTLLTLNRGEAKVEEYWSMLETATEARGNAFAGGPQDAVDELERLLSASVARQMVADVPLGAFLSGGIDSSTIVALMQKQSATPIKTFTIGFSEREYDEAQHAAAVARHLGTDHRELYVSPDDALDIIPHLAQIYSEPFADASQIPTFLVSKLARESVTVSLSGDAGDELFGGYDRYGFANGLWNKIGPMPKGVRQLGGAMMGRISPETWNQLAGPFFRHRFSNVGDKIAKGARLLQCDSVEDLYFSVIAHCRADDNVVIDPIKPSVTRARQTGLLQSLAPTERMMALDSVIYLPDDILVKVDRAGMSVSLESRIPMLDQAIVAFAWSLPLSFKIRDGVTKWPLRELLYRHVPKEIVDRPKMGFGVPIAEWLRGPLHRWANDVLDEDVLAADGLLDAKKVRRLWEEHVSGRRNWAYRLWNIIMFQSWYNGKRARSATEKPALVPA